MVAQHVRKEKTISAILMAARTCFGEDGYAATTIDDIAQLAGVTKGAIYHHFSSKTQIFESVHETLSDQLSQSVMASLRSQKQLFEAVKTALDTFFKKCSDETLVKIIFEDGPKVLGEDRWREIDRKNFGGQIRDVLVTGMQSGLLQTYPVEPLTNLFNSAINESILQCVNAENFTETSQNYIDAIMFLLSGISVPQA